MAALVAAAAAVSVAAADAHLPTTPLYAVTGGTGFLGEHLTQQLLSRGCRVRVLSRSLPPPQKRTAPTEGNTGRVEMLAGSILDDSALDRLLDPAVAAAAAAAEAGVDSGSSSGAREGEGKGARRVDGIFHLAGVVEHSRQHEEAMRDVTVGGTLAVLRAAKRAGVRRVVYASTSGTVAVSRDPLYVADDTSPYAKEVTMNWPYYRTKIEAEESARKYAEEHRLELICMRPTLLLGPGDKRLSSCRTVYDLMQRSIPLMPSGGLSFVDVRDTAAAFLAAMEVGTAGATYLLGATNMTLADYFEQVGRIAGVLPPSLRVPDGLAWALAAVASTLAGAIGRADPSLDPVVVEMSQCFWYLSCMQARQELGFSPRDPQETLRDTVQWLRLHGKEIGAATPPL